MKVRIRDAEGCEPEVQLLWDTVWIQRLDGGGGYGDWLLAGPGDTPESRGGLRAAAALHTATMLCLFTDRRIPDDMESPFEDGDPRGWWGDSVRLEGEPEVPMGSLLWTLERAVLNDETAARARAYAEDALDVLRAQGAVARTEVEAEALPALGQLGLAVRHFDRSGRQAYAQRFDVLWQQSARGAEMNYGDRRVLV